MGHLLVLKYREVVNFITPCEVLLAYCFYKRTILLGYTGEDFMHASVGMFEIRVLKNNTAAKSERTENNWKTL